MAILNRFSVILLYCDSTHFLDSRCEISGDSRPAILRVAPLQNEIALKSFQF